MSNILVALLVLLYSFQSSFCNMYARNYKGNPKNSSGIYSVVYGVVVAAATFVFAGFSYKPSAVTLILGTLCGLVLVLYNDMLIAASTSGPYSVTMIFNLFGGILLPMFWSIVYDGEKLSILQFVSIGVMLISFIFLCSSNKKQEGTNEKISLKFLIYVLLLGLANGLYGTFMNSQKNATDSTENPEMIITVFAVSAIAAFILLLIKSGPSSMRDFALTPKAAAFSVIASISAASAVNILMYALSLMNVAVLYSLNNGGVLVVSIIWAMLILREKPGIKRIIGLVMAIAAIFALSIF